MLRYLGFLCGSVWRALTGKYGWMVILFALWLYRVDFVVADEGGLAKALQVVTIFGMLGLVMLYNSRMPAIAYRRSNVAVRTLMWFYSYAVMSTLWAFLPTFAFFLSFQNIVLTFLLLWFFSKTKCFLKMEYLFLMASIAIILFEQITYRLLEVMAVFVHLLASASAAAMIFSYSVGEYMASTKNNPARKKLLRFSILISLIVLFVSTSSGANASAALGFAVGMFLSGKVFYSILLFIGSIVLFLNQDAITQLVLILMPGKSMETLASASGRSALWDILLSLAAEKPMFGWGYACIERVVTSTGFDASDAHNNYLGIYGSLGIVGCLLFGIHLLSSLLYMLRRKMRPGYVGLCCALCCAILNGYSYGFLSGKACSSTIIYIALMALSYYYCKVPFYDQPSCK